MLSSSLESVLQAANLPEIFTNLSTNACFLVCFTHGITFIGAAYYLPFYTQSVLGFTPLKSGLLVLPTVLSESAMGLLNGFLMLKTGRYREVIRFGTTLLTLGTGLYILFGVGTSIGMIIGFELLGGVGSGFLFEAPMVALQAVTAQDDTAAATAAFGFTRNMATTMSIVLGAVVFQNGMDRKADDLRAAGLNSTLVEAFSGGQAQANVEMIKTIRDAGQRRAVEEAFAFSMRNMWIMYTCIIAGGFVASWFVKHVDLKTEHTETRTGIKKREEVDAAVES